MTKAGSKFVALFAVALFVVGFGIIACNPATSYAQETKLAAGTTFAGAKDITPTEKGSIASKTKGVVRKGDLVISRRNLATFDTENDNEYYKFKTSNRNSTYRITVKKEDNDGRAMQVEIRDSKLRRFNTGAAGVADMTYQVSFSAANGVINRNEYYYIELSRYIPESAEGTNNRSPYVDYRITVEEIVPKPKAIGENAYSAKLYTDQKKLQITVSKRSFYADGYNVQLYVPRLKKWISIKFKGVTYALQNDGVATTVSLGKSYWGYICKIRPYRLVNGKTVYGNWTKTFTKFKDGKYVKCTKKFTSGDGVKFKKGKYYNYKDKVKQLTGKERKNFKRSKGKMVKYAMGKKASVVG